MTAAPRATARLTKPLRDRVRAGHPWIYDRALALPTGARPGDVVTVVDAEGPLAVAYVDPTSPIRGRVLALDVRARIDDAWARARARAAAARRVRDPLLAGCTGWRVVHGEGDGCPGLVIDRYGETCVIVFDGGAAAAFWRPLLPAVLAGLRDGGLVVAHAWLRGERGRGAAGTAIAGDPPAAIEIHEDDARFAVDVRAGQKTGFFLDQRENRRTIRKHAAGQTVLNLYCYTGGFSLHAALGGAARVTSVDVAAPAIAAVGDNVTRTGLDRASHELVAEDAFAFLARARTQGRTWDLVIADPPSFAPSEKARQSALSAYGKLASAALAVTANDGRFAFASCSSHVTEADLVEIAAREVARSGRTLALRGVAGAASDHPVLPAFPEGRYLKFLLFDVG